MVPNGIELLIDYSIASVLICLIRNLLILLTRHGLCWSDVLIFQTLWISRHTESSYMVSHQCALFQDTSNHLVDRICSHTMSNWMVFFTIMCFFMFLKSTRIVKFLLAHWAIKWFITKVDYFMCFEVIWSSKFLITMWAAKRFLTSVDFLMLI